GATSTWIGSKVPLNDEGGRTKYLLSASIDVSDLKRSEAALRESEQRYRQLVEATGALSYTWDVDSRRFLFVGPRAEQMLGYPVEKWTSEGFWASCIHPEDREKQVARSRWLDDAGFDRQDEYRMIAADGGIRWVRDVMTFRLDKQGRHVAQGLIFDETESKQRDQVLAQAQKMEALGQLTGGVAHDFNNMLMVIGGNLDLLTRRIGADPLAHESVKLARDATRAAADLTKYRLAFARRQVLRPQTISLATLMPAMRQLLARTLGERIKCRFVIGEEIWPVRVDLGQLQSAMLNLALNARDAMRDGGQLTFTAMNLDGERAAASILAQDGAGKYVKISVRDSGTGMTPEVLARAFEPFFTTKGGAKGSGLGLSMVYGFVKQSGGHITVESPPGAGTNIEILLPRAQMDVETDTAPASSPPTSIKGESILVVEDNPRVRATSVRMLE
ncbi:MAG: ATP-binding protein, partial [Pseudomonadota bacterium]